MSKKEGGKCWTCDFIHKKGLNCGGLKNLYLKKSLRNQSLKEFYKKQLNNYAIEYQSKENN